MLEAEAKKSDSERPFSQGRPSLIISFLSHWAPLGVTIIAGLLLTPYLIGHLGKRDYGIWALAGSFVGYYGLLRLGVGAGLMRYVPFYAGREDHKSASEMVSTGMAIFLSVGLVILAVSFLAAKPIAHFYKAGAEMAALVRILGLAAAIECPMRILDGTVRAQERWAIANSVSTLRVIMLSLGLASCVYLGYGIVEMGYVVLAVATISMILIAIVFVKFCPQLHLGVSMVKLSCVPVLLSFGFLSTIVALAWSLTLQGHKLIIGKLMSLEAVAVYAVAAVLMSRARAVVVMPNRVFWPRFALLDAKNNHTEVGRLFRRCTRYNAVFASGLFMLVIAAGPSFIRLWVGEGFEAVYPALVILAIGYLIETSLAVIPPLLSGIGHQRTKAVVAVAEGILGLGLSALLTWKMGLPGAALGFTISIALIRGLICSWYICRLFKVSILRYYQESLVRPWSIMLILTLAIYSLNLTKWMHDWPSLILLALAIGASFAVLAYSICVDQRAKESLLNSVWKVSGRKC